LAEEQQTPDQLADHREDARRNARYTYAQRRIQKIVDGMPPLTDEQLTSLAVLLHPEHAS
jgi:hypothetical protein